MSEVKDPAIKLFGKTIPLSPYEQFSGALIATATTTTTTHVAIPHDDDHEQLLEHCSNSRHNLLSSTSSGKTQEDCKKPSESELTETREEDGTSHSSAEEIKDPATSCENPKTPSVEEEPISPKVPKNDEQSETSIVQGKTLKKPDKILPCPRCNSMDTKFCYYNNYNVNQPRHFCKNCQRYWTAGGTMRSVPVGSGRRKNKSSSASYYRHIIVSEALQAARADAANGIQHPRTNGTVLTFGSDAPPLCESMASALKLAEKSQNCAQNGFHRPEQNISVSCGGRENGDEHSSRSSITASDSADKGGNSVLQESVMTNFQTLPQPCFPPGPPWPCPWNSPQWRSAIPPPTFGPSGFPITFYPVPPYWGCTLPGSWNVPWPFPPPSSANTAMCSSPNSPTLGKHSRDGDVLKPSNSGKEEPLKENNPERGVWIPKTLRIDDPSEAAKSSIWATLGIKHEKNDSINGGGLFKAFQSKGDDKAHTNGTSLVLQANPAALCRSLNFRESA